MLVYTTNSYQHLQSVIDHYNKLSPPYSDPAKAISGQVKHVTFPDGERYMRITSMIEDHDAVLIGGTISDEDTLELYDLACGLVDQGVRSLTIIIPYFGYSTMERAVNPGEIVTAKTRARLFSSLPLARYGNRIVLFDLHTEGLPYYFEGATRTYHVYGKKLVMQAVRMIAQNNIVLASTDAGRAKWVESLANDLGVPAAFVFKRRLSGDRTEISGISADVKGREVIIYDDMIRTGGSLMGAAKAYLAAGATSVSAVATHGVLPGDSLRKLSDSGLFKAIICTDSHPNAVKLQGAGVKNFQVLPTSKVFAEFLTDHPVAG